MVEKISKLPKCAENVTNFAYAFYEPTMANPLADRKSDM